MVTKLKGSPLWLRPGWKWLFSLRVGLLLLLLLTLASILGTLITPLERAQQRIYYAWWYKYLLLLPLAVNMACATARTILGRILPPRRGPIGHEQEFYRSTAGADEIPFTAGVEAAAATFRRRGFRVGVDGTCGYASRGLLSRWGAPIAHLGFILVLLGGFASSWLAREGNVSLTEGEQTNQMELRTNPPVKQPLGFTLRCDDFETGYFPKTRIPSRFTSIVSVQEGAGPWMTQPVEVNRSLTVAGWEVHQTSFQEVEEQERYRLAVSATDSPGTVTLEISPGQRRPIPHQDQTEIELSPPGSPLTWTILKQGRPAGQGNLTDVAAAGGYRLRAVQFEPDFVMAQTIGSRSQNLNNPALKIALIQGAQPVNDQWLFAREELKQMMQSMHSQKGPFAFDLVGVTGQAPHWKAAVAVRDAAGAKLGEYKLAVGEEVGLGPVKAAAPSAAMAHGWRVKLEKRVPAYATVLTLTRNPAIPVVYLGCALMLLGIIVAFFIRCREVWFRVDEAGKRLLVVARSRHQPSGLDNATRRMLLGSLICVLLLFGGAVGQAAPLANPLGPEWRKALEPLASMPVQDFGYVRSAYTFGDNHLSAIANKHSSGGMNCLEAVLYLMANPEAAYQAPLIKVVRPELSRFFGAKMISLEQFRDKARYEQFAGLIQHNQKLADAADDVESRAAHLEQIEHDFAIIPHAGEWLSPEHLPANASVQDRAIVRQWAALKLALRQNQSQAGAKAARELAASVRAAAQAQSIPLPHLGLDLFFQRHEPFGKAAILYLLAALTFGASLLFGRKGLGWFGYSLMTLGFAEQGVGLTARWILAGRAPLANMYESFTFAIGGMILVALVFEWIYKNRLAGLGGATLGFIFMVLADKVPIFDSQIRPLMPALQSSWLTYHVVVIMLSYSAFALSFFVSLTYLAKDFLGGDATANPMLRRLPTLAALDLFNYKIIAVGFPLLTLGIVLGALWASTAWGRPWGFDPKETWSAVTWLIYAIYLHTRYLAGWKGRRAAVVALIGFAGVLFTYLGVNYLLPGLHSYV